MVNLTDRFILGAKTRGGKQTDYPDDKIKGLALRVSPGGAKSWTLRYRRQADGKQKRFTIGEYPAFSLKEARDEAQDVLREVARGKDPALEKRKARHGHKGRPVTFGELAELYIAQRIPQMRQGRQGERSLIKDAIPQLGDMLLDEIESADIATVTQAVIARGAPIMANRTFSWIQSVLTWGRKQGISKANPATDMSKPSKEKSRERALSEDEIVAFWHCVETKGNIHQAMRLLLKLLLVTGQRINEIAEMERAELCNIDGSDAQLHIPAERMKGGRPHITPLTPLAVTLIKEALTLADGSRYVFPNHTTGTPYHLNTASGVMRRYQGLEKNCKAVLQLDEPATPHDLRRTVGTNLGRLRVPRFIQDRVLAHSDRSIGAIYDRWEYLDEKREALTKWDTYLQALLGLQPAVVVVSQPAKVPSPWAA